MDSRFRGNDGRGQEQYHLNCNATVWWGVILYCAENVIVVRSRLMVNSSPTRDSYLTRVRNVSLLPGERVTRLFSPTLGFIDEPSARGYLLVATTRRVMAFAQGDSSDETYLATLESLQAAVYRRESRGTGSLFQGLLVVLGALAVYLVLAYQLTGSFEGPVIPIISMDAGAVAVLVAVVVAAWLMWKHYFTGRGGSISFQGSTWSFSFPCRGRGAREHVYELLDAVFQAQGRRV